MSRAIAACLGLFALLSGRDNLWWIDVRPLPHAVLLLPGLVLAVYGLSGRGRRAVVVTAALLMGVALVNTVRVVALGAGLPFSLLVVGLLALVIRAPRRGAVGAVLALGIGLPLAQVFFFGTTSYARPADRIVVFGARCYADGRPSQTLEDRVRTGCRLYRAGLAPRLVLSGGPGDGAVHETDAMLALARQEGVPRAAIVLDREGLDTRATVRNTGPGRVLAVSHFYHLPRIKLAYRRAGRTAYTVPAAEAYTVRQTPYLVAREVAAFWWYWIRTSSFWSFA